MDSTPHLLREDRPEFERLLDDALRTAHTFPDPSAGGGRRPGRAQLRSMALSAAEPIAACAGAEYRHFVSLRAEFRRPGNAPPPAGPAPAGPTTRERLADRSGAGMVAVVSVLAPMLAGAAAVVLLLLGYGLHLLRPEPALAAPVRDTGWIFVVLAAATALLGMCGILLAALRNGPRAAARRTPGPGDPDPAEQVAAARAAWRAALLENGILPFLREAGAGLEKAGYRPDDGEGGGAGDGGTTA
ncbi:hypothetical protein [Streptomyces sp. TR06-5]|uniref:hypothetical protein n=1 Tax=unclassified Streptomyces TaxID=2593676 RepID=UPI0039A121C2